MLDSFRLRTGPGQHAALRLVGLLGARDICLAEGGLGMRPPSSALTSDPPSNRLVGSSQPSSAWIVLAPLRCPTHMLEAHARCNARISWVIWI
jgi:hypothetical protein